MVSELRLVGERSMFCFLVLVLHGAQRRIANGFGFLRADFPSVKRTGEGFLILVFKLSPVPPQTS